VAAPALLAGGVLAASVALHVRDPHAQGSWGFCPWLILTGTQCPGCGGLRAVKDLTDGDVAAAFSSNALFVMTLPALVWAWARSVRSGWTGERRPLPPGLAPALTWVIGLAVVCFWIVRNLPVGSYLAP
jgi:hypothetical protein